jgi:hypothetical protein
LFALRTAPAGNGGSLANAGRAEFDYKITVRDKIVPTHAGYLAVEQ